MVRHAAPVNSDLVQSRGLRIDALMNMSRLGSNNLLLRPAPHATLLDHSGGQSTPDGVKAQPGGLQQVQLLQALGGVCQILLKRQHRAWPFCLGFVLHPCLPVMQVPTSSLWMHASLCCVMRAGWLVCPVQLVRASQACAAQLVHAGVQSLRDHTSHCSMQQIVGDYCTTIWAWARLLDAGEQISQ